MRAIAKRRPEGSKRSKEPALFWHPRARQWMSKIGYHFSKKTKQRVRSYQYLGTDERAARTLANGKAEEWDKIVADAKALKKTNEKTNDGLYDLMWHTDKREVSRKFQPVWPDADTLDRAQKIKDEAEKSDRRELTIEQVKEKYEKWYTARVGLAGGKGIKPKTAITHRINLQQSLRMIDRDKPLCQITSKDLEIFVHKWMELPQRNDEREGRVTERTAVNYCKTFRQFLGWCADQDFDFTEPKGTTDIFKLKAAAERFDTFTTAELKTMFDAGAKYSGTTKLYMILALNCGYYR